MNILAALKRCGVRLAVDDLGAGYSSLSALKRFPLDTVKIDRSFIRGVASDEADKSVAQAIIAMAQTSASRSSRRAWKRGRQTSCAHA